MKGDEIGYSLGCVVGGGGGEAWRGCGGGGGGREKVLTSICIRGRV